MTTVRVNEMTERSLNQRTKILVSLREAGQDGMTNIELGEISMRWAARLQELYMQGYKVAKENLGDGIFSYVLVEEPVAILPEPPRAVDILVSAIERDFCGVVTSAQLKYILSKNNLLISRKPNSFNN